MKHWQDRGYYWSGRYWQRWHIPRAIARNRDAVLAAVGLALVLGSLVLEAAWQ